MSHEQHKKHITPLWVYLAVGATLLVMTGLTIAAAEINFTALTGFSEMNFIIAMAIATFKALLVALFFMHLIYDNKFFMFSLAAGVGVLMIFIALTLSDTNFRGKVNAVEYRPIQAQVGKEKFVESNHSQHESPEQPAQENHH